MVKAILDSYTPSGKVGLSLSWKLPLALVFVLACSVLYVSAIRALPTVFVAFAVFVLYYFAIGWSANGLIRWGRVRNPAVGAGVGLLLGFAAIYFSWVGLLPAMAAKTGGEVKLLDAAAHPQIIFQQIPHIAEQGWFEVFGMRVQGTGLIIIWLAEALLLLGYPAFRGARAAQNRLFCETCNQWAEQQPELIGFYYPDQAKLTEGFKNGEPEMMDLAETIFNVPVKNYFQVDSEVCTGCNDCFSLSLLLMHKASDIDKAKPELLCRQLVVGRPIFQHYLMLKGQFPCPELT